ncbi:ABC transporter substrate-binding protein [Shewanella marisflavi]|uniref:ABC transporter substrate-binding protein n=2 Tax=Shewanellaceae TaxID=267890 RepID=A0ABX5WQ30_9GAMM|nr:MULTISPECIES: ABC transporter substrate-binding protein [Shewanella]QDF76589.1 ABC transporter substrate-binding protein [Shewanella marisflavi]
MKQLLKVVFSAMVLLTSAAASSEDISVNTKDPYAMVESVANKTFARFHQDFATIKANPDHLKVIVSDELMPYIDYKYASYKVMGPYLRQSTPEQRERFADAFKTYLIATYAQAFTEYTDQEVEFAPAKRFDDEKMVDVNVQVIEQGRPPIKLIFKVRRLKDDTWKAFDLVAEGVSLLASKSAEISNLIRQNGIDAVIKELETHTENHISLVNQGTRL